MTHKTSTPKLRPALSPAQRLLFVLPWVPVAFILTPAGMFIPAFYASHTTVTLAAIGAVTGIARLFDAACDPVIGYLSDHTRSRFGARKPWTIAGALLFALSVWFLFQPPPTAGIGYFLGWSGLLYFSYACVEIPLRAWASELSRDHMERARTFTMIGLSRAAGGLAFWLLPFALTALIGVSTLNSTRSMSAAALLFVCSLLLSVFCSVAFVPKVKMEEMLRQSPLAMLDAVRRNRPFWTYAGAQLLWSFSVNCSGAVLFIYLSDYLALGEHVMPLMITYFIVQVAAMPLWIRLAGKLDKHRVVAACWLLDGLMKLPLMLIEPDTASLPVLYLLFAASAVLASVAFIFPHAILADIADFDMVKGRVNRSASYFALNTLIFKIMQGVGAATALLLLSASGYQMQAVHDTAARLGIIGATLGLPGLAIAGAALCMWKMPIGLRAHRAISRRLAARERAAAAAGK